MRLSTDWPSSRPYQRLTRPEMEEALRRVRAQMGKHGRLQDERLFVDLAQRVVAILDGGKWELMLRFQRASRTTVLGRVTTTPEWVAAPIEDAVDHLVAPNSMEDAWRQHVYDALEGERAATEAAAQSAQKSERLRREEEQRLQRLDAWRQRPRIERALLVLSATREQVTPADIAAAVAAEPEFPMALPPGDADLGSKAAER